MIKRLHNKTYKDMIRLIERCFNVVDCTLKR